MAILSKLPEESYPWRSVSTWRLTTSPRAILISSSLQLNSETFIILPLLKHISCLRVRFLIKLMGWQWALPLPRCWLIFSWVMMKGFGWKTSTPPVFYFIDAMLTILLCLFDTEHDATLFFDYINDRHPNIGFTMEKEKDNKIPFLDVLIDNSQPLSPITRVYPKKTFTGLLTNYFSFTPFSYKLG